MIIVILMILSMTIMGIIAINCIINTISALKKQESTYGYVVCSLLSLIFLIGMMITFNTDMYGCYIIWILPTIFGIVIDLAFIWIGSDGKGVTIKGIFKFVKDCIDDAKEFLDSTEPIKVEFKKIAITLFTDENMPVFLLGLFGLTSLVPSVIGIIKFFGMASTI